MKNGGKLVVLAILIGVILLLTLTGCGEVERSTDTYYVKTKFILVSKDKCGESKTMIIQHPSKEFMYRELTNEDLVTDEMYYTYEVGDEMYFEWLVKDKFYAVDPDEESF